MTGAGHAVIALGSNLGDRQALFTAARRDIAETPGIDLEAISSFHETPALRPWGVDPEAPAYLNAVALVSTTLDPESLLDRLNAVERAHGRVRDERWGDRTLDLDIVAMGERTLHTERVTLPHPRAHERDFVLRPWLEIAPDAVLPGHGTVRQLVAALEAAAESGAHDDEEARS